MTTEFFVTVIRSYEREDLTLLKISKKEVVKQMALTGQNEDNWKSAS